MTKFLIRSLFLTAVFLATVGPPKMVAAETFVGTNVDNRVLIAYKVDPAAMAAWVPDGWQPVAFPSGPLAGANLLVVLIDRQLQLDPEGKPASPANSRHVVFAGLGQEAAGNAVRLYVYRILASDPLPNPYGNSVAAKVLRKTTDSGDANGARMRTEYWSVETGQGTNMTLELAFNSGRRSWSSAEANPFSNTDTDFSRIYRYDQLVDVVSSAAMGKPLHGTYTLKAFGPEVGDLFSDGAEVVGIMDVPVYVRKVFLP